MKQSSSEDEPGLPAAYDPKPACPLLFHMFGHVADPSSLVLTEDDYLDFLVRTSDKQDLIPQCVQNAMRNNSLLFLGYQTNDLDFRVILRSLSRIRRDPRKSSNYTIQFVHVSDDKVTSEQIDRLKNYFKDYNKSMAISVYWGTTGEFMTELRQRWEVYCVNSPAWLSRPAQGSARTARRSPLLRTSAPGLSSRPTASGSSVATARPST